MLGNYFNFSKLQNGGLMSAPQVSGGLLSVPQNAWQGSNFIMPSQDELRAAQGVNFGYSLPGPAEGTALYDAQKAQNQQYGANGSFGALLRDMIGSGAMSRFSGTTGGQNNDWLMGLLDSRMRG